MPTPIKSRRLKESPPSTPSKSHRPELVSLPRSSEERFYGPNIEVLIGVDEAGRGPLAGPVVVAACSIKRGVCIPGIIDSKATKEEDRESTYEILVTHPHVKWAVEIIDEKVIDEINILQASLLGMRNATKKLLTKYASQISPTNCLALVDGNKIPSEMPTHEVTCVIKGDSTIFSIAAASIIAKVTRDRLMLDLDKKYPEYQFAQHKGYPTLLHRTLLMRHGPCEVHRMSYSPVKCAKENSKGTKAPATYGEGENEETKLVGKREGQNKEEAVEIIKRKKY